MSMMVAGSYIRQWVQKRKDYGLTPENSSTAATNISDSNEAHTYLKHLGFFDYIGLKGAGNAMGEASGNTRYQPIREIRRQDLENDIQVTGGTLADAIQFRADGIADVLSSGNIQTRNAFRYAIREIIRNTFEHSEADSCFVCAQRWYGGRVEIAIVDEGVGIASTLQQGYDIEETQALTEAIKPGVTRTHKMTDEENIHDNSGYGLYALSELGSSFGWFRLGSGSQSLIHQARHIELVNLPYQGTYVGLRLNSVPSDFRGTLNDIIQVGEAEAETKGRLSAASELSKKV